MRALTSRAAKHCHDNALNPLDASRDEDFRKLVRDGFGHSGAPLRSASTKLERTAAPVKDRKNHMRARRGHLVMRDKIE